MIGVGSLAAGEGSDPAGFLIQDPPWWVRTLVRTAAAAALAGHGPALPMRDLPWWVRTLVRTAPAAVLAGHGSALPMRDLPWWVRTLVRTAPFVIV
ncbi:hypothetical protein, partial [Stenotrophomonas maltophilia]|uniref:hypothetical protein n=1 Tax=Stenotrophomonas maltophilia TaxID=40324 RepID=UPI001C658318